MYVKKSIGVFELLSEHWKAILGILVFVTSTSVVYTTLLRESIDVSITALSGFSAAISFFIAFFTAQAYSRWWEARKIWGSFVNDSRSFGRMVMTLFGPAERDVPEIQHRLVRRHIAYLYAVKERLRNESPREYTKYLSDEDATRVTGSSNIGNTILQLQGEDIDAAERENYIDVIRLAQFNDMLSRFSTSQGMAERIKTTVFPAYYASMIRVSIWIYILAFPPSLSEEIGFMAIPVSAVLVLFFYLIFSIGRVMLDPFEGKPHDTPMSSIIRTIEINLLEQIGDDNIPAPLEPIKARYLM